MVKITILYPNNNDSHFDMSYYLETHMPMAIERLSAHPGFKGVSVERDLGGLVPKTDPVYAAISHFLFESTEDFMTAFTPHSAALQGDIPNYTNIEPLIQVSEVLLSR
jgi:uncharacterized protein (TIGR02118 family)